MKKVFKNPLFTFILGVVIAASFSVYATVSILSSQVDYIPRDSEWNVNNVEDAIDDLYNMASANANGSNGFVGLAFNFSYTNTQQTFTVPATGEYKIELWGAQGGTVSSYVGGLGSYTKGIISLDKGDLLYIFVGQKGNNAPLPNQVGSYNGGGGIEGAGSSVHPGCIGGGGGATDIRLVGSSYSLDNKHYTYTTDANSLNSRIMVAAGGGGGAGTCYSDKPGPGAAGGGLTGYNTVGYLNKTSYGGSQTSGGTGYLYGTGNGSRSVDGGFGYGGAGGYWPWGGGGAGYYGGGSGGGGQGGGTSGSSYISGHAGCVAVSDNSTTEPRDVKSGCSTITDDNRLECSKHSSGLSFTDTEMIDGTGYNWTTEKGSYVGQPQPDGSTAAGHSNDGYARITYLG